MNGQVNRPQAHPDSIAVGVATDASQGDSGGGQWASSRLQQRKRRRGTPFGNCLSPSGNKPYCDNSHVGSGFKDEGTCKPGEMVPVANGPLTLILCTDAPVQGDGPVTIFDAFGDQVTTAQQAWLCRCGASKNKPYSDGSHKAVGFRS